MKRIPLTQGKFALVDDELFDYLNQWKWYYKEGYAARTLKTIRMHRVIMNAPIGVEVDHRNRNKLDNQRTNLRLADDFLNNQNQGIRKDNTSGQKGVHYNSLQSKWVARLQFRNKRIFLGSYKTKEEAIVAYQQAQTEYQA